MLKVQVIGERLKLQDVSQVYHQLFTSKYTSQIFKQHNSLKLHTSIDYIQIRELLFDWNVYLFPHNEWTLSMSIFWLVFLGLFGQAVWVWMVSWPWVCGYYMLWLDRVVHNFYYNAYPVVSFNLDVE